MVSIVLSKIRELTQLIGIPAQSDLVTWTTIWGISVLILILAIDRALTLPVPRGYSKIPGPKGLPVVGHTFSVPLDNPHIVFKKWARQYGEIYQIQLGFQKWIFLSSGEAAKELIDRQSALSSSRPPMPSADFVSGYRRMLIMPYGDKWRNLRSIIHTMFTPKASAVFKPSQEFEAKQLLADMFNSREDEGAFYQHVRRYTTSVILTSTYGFRVPVWVRRPLRFFEILSQHLENRELTQCPQDCEDVREIYGLMADFGRVASPGEPNTFSRRLEAAQ
jgi:cytochrome P450